MHTTKYLLFQALVNGGPLTVNTAHFHIVNMVEREDGSGHSFNVTGYNAAGLKITAHTRTID